MVILIPIPLHNVREKWRGFNQSSLVGEKIAEELGFRYEENLLLRVLNKTAQVGLNREDRLTNMKEVFKVNKKIKIDNKYLYLVFDDVWTTGATLKECCFILKKMGAKSVWALTIAR